MTQTFTYDGTPRFVHFVYKFTGKERDTESGLDYMDARYYGSAMGRFMSPDPLGGHPEDPQTLNRYAYARNNPLTFSDPTGLDFNLTCTAAKGGSNASTCQGGVQGTTTTANGKSTFTATVITSASLSDPKSGNTANVNENGVQITTAQGTSGAKFIDNTPAADINGSGKLADFSFHINGSCGGTCLDSGTFKFNGTPDQARDLLDQRGAFRSIVDWTIPGLGKSVDEMKFMLIPLNIDLAKIHRPISRFRETLKALFPQSGRFTLTQMDQVSSIWAAQQRG